MNRRPPPLYSFSTRDSMLVISPLLFSFVRTPFSPPREYAISIEFTCWQFVEVSPCHLPGVSYVAVINSFLFSDFGDSLTFGNRRLPDSPLSFPLLFSVRVFGPVLDPLSARLSRALRLPIASPGIRHIRSAKSVTPWATGATGLTLAPLL